MSNLTPTTHNYILHKPQRNPMIRKPKILKKTWIFAVKNVLYCLFTMCTVATFFIWYICTTQGDQTDNSSAQLHHCLWSNLYVRVGVLWCPANHRESSRSNAVHCESIRSLQHFVVYRSGAVRVKNRNVTKEDGTNNGPSARI